MMLKRLVIAAAMSATLVLTACSGGSNAVDQQAGGQFRYVQASTKGTVISEADRKVTGDVHGSLLFNGGTYSLAADKGHVVVLNFFATWCGPCQTETPQFDALYRERKASGVRFVGLDVKDGSQSGTESWLTAKQISFPVVWDQPGKTAIELGGVPIAGLPATVVIDKQGRVAAVYSGLTLPADLTPALNTLAGET